MVLGLGPDNAPHRMAPGREPHTDGVPRSDLSSSFIGIITPNVACKPFISELHTKDSEHCPQICGGYQPELAVLGWRDSVQGISVCVCSDRFVFVCV